MEIQNNPSPKQVGVLAALGGGAVLLWLWLKGKAPGGAGEPLPEPGAQQPTIRATAGPGDVGAIPPQPQ